MAVPMDLTSIKVGGYTGATTDEVSVQVIDATGNVEIDSTDKAKVYYWRDADGSNGKWVKKDGRKITDLSAEEVVLNPGDGIWVQNYATSTPYKLMFAAPTL